MKYIVCEVKREGETIARIPVIFPDLLVHSMVFAQMRAMLETTYFSNRGRTTVEPLSGGFISSMSFEGGDLCTGKSESLGVVSRGKLDDQLIRMTDYGSTVAF